MTKLHQSQPAIRQDDALPPAGTDAGGQARHTGLDHRELVDTVQPADHGAHAGNRSATRAGGHRPGRRE